MYVYARLVCEYFKVLAYTCIYVGSYICMYVCVCVCVKKHAGVTGVHLCSHSLVDIVIEQLFLYRGRFSQPHKDLWTAFVWLRAHELDPDLIYAPKTWIAMEEWLSRQIDQNGGERALDDLAVMYIHTGGQRGNESMLERYENYGGLGSSMSEEARRIRCITPLPN